MNNNGPMTRMKLGTAKDTVQETKIEDAPEVEEVIATVESKDVEETKAKFEDSELIKDLNLEQFYFTGILEHTFNVKKLSFNLRLMKSEELEETNRILWDLAAEKISLEMIMFSHAIEVIGRTLTKYGKIDLSSMSTEERVKFVRANIPGIVIPKIARMYDLLEASANKVFSEDSDELKN